MSEGFFGNLSPFQVIVSCIALLTGAHTLYTLLAKPRLKIFLADSIGLVVPPSEVTNRFHLGCNLVNPTAKVGTLHRLEAEVYDPQGDSRVFQWNLFFEYGPGGNIVQKTTDPYPLAVSPRNNLLQFVEFKAAEGVRIDSWPEGRYELRLLGWANRPTRKSSPNVKAIFHIEIDQILSMCLEGTESDQNQVIRVPIVEWNPTKR